MSQPKMFRPAAPFYIQFEVTEACNHNCFFCYNQAMSEQAEELTTKEAKDILDQMRKMGVFSINFNGGEPLARPDFFEIAAHAKKLGFDIHLNSNATLINENKADMLAELFPSICTSVLAAQPEKHDRLVGVPGAYEKMYRGVSLLLDRGVNVEINVCTFKDNYRELYEIASSMAREGVHVFCVTRYIMVTMEGAKHVLGAKETVTVLETLERIHNELPTYKEVKLPGPVPYCELESKYAEQLRKWNTPCQIGYGLARISSQGTVTPCPLSPDVIGSLRENDFASLWRHERWSKYETFSHLPVGCRECQDIESCRGGCVGYDDCLNELGSTPFTKKWGNDRG
jgi:AdoMet-dependent heme synthase